MEYISYCGLLCNECPVYLATKENDEIKKEKLAKEYSFENMVFTKEDINCFGCFSEKTKDSKMCSNCPIMNCAKNKEIKNCGYCIEYPCDIINKHLPQESSNRKRLDAINKNN
jgi:hypothetical protein